MSIEFTSEEKKQKAYEHLAALARLSYDFDQDKHMARWKAVQELADRLIGDDADLPMLT